jgi:uncharacterized protein
MAASLQDLRSHLMAVNEEFRKLSDQHHSYDEQLQRLAGKTYLNDQEKLEEVKLKKLKLRMKDEMERMVHEFSRGHTPMAS